MRRSCFSRAALLLFAAAWSGGGLLLAQETEPDDRRSAPDAVGDESQIDLGLGWLARHQLEDGRWSASEYATCCPASDGARDDGDEPSAQTKRADVACSGAGTLDDITSTALVLLTFLGAGETHASGPHRAEIVAAVKWMARQQRASGQFGLSDDERALSCHTFASRAFVELYGLTGSRLAKSRAVGAVEYLIGEQRASGAWGHGMDDPAATGHALFVLRLARMAKLRVSDDVITKALAWLATRTTSETGAFDAGGARDPFGADATTSATASSLVARIWLRDRETVEGDVSIERGADWLLARLLPLPAEATGASTYDWLTATHALLQVGGARWERWRAALFPALRARQSEHGCARGSFPPIDANAAASGRLITTALSVLAAEARYRYDRVLAND